MKICNSESLFVKQRTFIYFAVMLINLYSCSSADKGRDEHDLGNYHFKATVGGRKMNCNIAKFEGRVKDGCWEYIAVVGNEIRDYSFPFFNFVPNYSSLFLDFEICRHGGSIEPGSYSTQTEQGMVVRYGVDTPDGINIYGTDHAKDVFTVEIEKINKDGIKGTFSGMVRNGIGQPLFIVDGSFNVPHDMLVYPQN